MLKISCQDGSRYGDKEVGLYEEEQAGECFIPLFEQHPP
jgi:hypothetical protein